MEPARAQKFISDHIDSVEQLHVLLLLLEHGERKWTAAEISAELRSSEGSVARRLKPLVDCGVLCQQSCEAGASGPARYSYAPISEELHAAVLAVAEFYRSCQFKVIDLILDRPNAAIRTFADAFRFRKDMD